MTYFPLTEGGSESLDAFRFFFKLQQQIKSDIRAFGIAGYWEAAALEAEVWVETVTEDERMFIVAEEVDAVRLDQEKREPMRLGKL